MNICCKDFISAGRRINKRILCVSLSFLFVSLIYGKDFIADNVKFAERQMEGMLCHSPHLANPCTITKDGKTKYIKARDWRSGFFPGSLWYMYKLTGDAKWKTWADKYSRSIEEVKNYTGNHDVGFMIYCSFGNGLRFSGNEEYKNVIIQTARSLCSRFRPKAGIIQSWNVTAKHRERGWICPVIIDNMMNLELLFEASLLSGDTSFKEIALSHLNKTLAHHFRPDGSCYHVVDYDPDNGNVRHRMTFQGLADESAWSRGQAWAIYGYTMAYRYTRDIRCLNQAIKTFEFMRNHPNMPKDCVPYWDMDVTEKDEPRDASSAAVIASALLELERYVSPSQAKDYRRYAKRILKSLSSSSYRAKVGENNYFLLKHSVTCKPFDSEVDVPLNYADYYYLEALCRYAECMKKENQRGK